MLDCVLARRGGRRPGRCFIALPEPRSLYQDKVMLKRVAALACVVGLFCVGCKHKEPKHAPEHESGVTTSGGVNVLVGAGDIADCRELDGAVATAKLLDNQPGTIFAAGDLADPDGTAEEFTNCYGPTWGRFKARTRPSTGNHEYHLRGATAYFEYWGDVAGKPGQGYYSYELAGWHIIVINSQCSEVGGCNAGSPQEQWLRRDLAAHPSACTLAYWHHPLFSSGTHGNAPEMKPIWQALYEANADVVINGHDHDYERFAAQDPDGRGDPQRGIREFVAGTGGRHTRAFGNPAPNSEVRQTRTFGVLKLTLHPASYDWQFIPVAGQSFSDSGSDTCH